MSERRILPEALERQLLEAQVADPRLGPDPVDAATLRERLHRRIEAAQGLTTIQADEGEWMKFSPKVMIKVLRRDTDTQTYLLRLEPGAAILPHVHGHDEECIVLEGEVRIGEVVARQGAYHLAPAGVPHEPITTETGALLFLRGAIPAARQVRWGRAAMHALTGR